MARTFNPLAAHGTVSPPHLGAVYFQDGGYFGPDGKLLFSDRAETPPKVVETETIVTDASTGESKTTVVETLVPDVAPAEPKPVLVGWLKGEITLTHPATVKLVKEAFGVALTKKADIIEYLVNTANLVPAELVKVQ